MEHKLCLEMKLTFIEAEELVCSAHITPGTHPASTHLNLLQGYSDVKTYGCNDHIEGSTLDAIKWLAAKIRKVPA